VHTILNQFRMHFYRCITYRWNCCSCFGIDGGILNCDGAGEVQGRREGGWTISNFLN